MQANQAWSRLRSLALFLVGAALFAACSQAEPQPATPAPDRLTLLFFYTEN